MLAAAWLAGQLIDFTDTEQLDTEFPRIRLNAAFADESSESSPQAAAAREVRASLQVAPDASWTVDEDDVIPEVERLKVVALAVVYSIMI